MINLDKIAALSALRIEPDERAALENDMAEIVEMVSGLPEYLGNPLYESEEAMELRSDSVKRSCSAEELMANAPETVNGCFAVPKTVEY